MKKSLLIIVFTISNVFYGMAQTEKGNYLLGGSASFSKGLSGTLRTSNFAVFPQFGYFIMKDFALGANLEYAHYGGTVSTNMYSAGPFARYYISVSEVFKPFVFASYGYGVVKYSNNIPYNSKQQALAAGVGFTYFLNKFIGLETTINYTHVKINYDYSNSSNVIYLGPSTTSIENMNILFGLQVYFGK